jgi:uncharacterized small protein (DUF1192 family)
MNEEFVNAYIEVLNKKIDELVKNDIMLLTRYSVAEKAIKAFSEENAALKEEIEKLQNSLNKKSVKLNKTEDF